MPSFIPLLIILVICIGVFGYMTYRNSAQRRAREKRRTQYHDRV
jgi:preprotein translocase subunit YajC